MTRQSNSFLCLVALLLSAFCSSQVDATCTPTVTVTPVYGPNFFTSPNFDDFRENFMNHLAFGTPGPDYNVDPTGFLPVGATVDPSEVIVSTFNSWRGAGDPTPGWDDPAGVFSGEFGNQVYFGLSVESPAGCNAEIDLRGISGSLVWEDSTGNPSASLLTQPPGQSFNWNLTGEDYDEFRWGVTGGTVYNDTNPAPGSMAVENVYYIGGITGLTAFDVATLDNQANLNKTLAKINDDFNAGDIFQIDVNYSVLTTLGKVTGATTTLLIPEPTGLFLGLVAVGILSGSRRKRLL